MDFADILQSMKNEKKCKNPYIPGSTGLPQNDLADKWHFFSIFQAKQFWEVQILAINNGMYVDNNTMNVRKRWF